MIRCGQNNQQTLLTRQIESRTNQLQMSARTVPAFNSAHCFDFGGCEFQLFAKQEPVLHSMGKQISGRSERPRQRKRELLLDRLARNVQAAQNPAARSGKNGTMHTSICPEAGRQRGAVTPASCEPKYGWRVRRTLRPPPSGFPTGSDVDGHIRRDREPSLPFPLPPPPH